MTPLLFEGWLYFNREGQLVGPVGSDELKQAVATGAVSPFATVWAEWHNPRAVYLAARAESVFFEEVPTWPGPTEGLAPERDPVGRPGLTSPSDILSPTVWACPRGPGQ